MPKRPTLPNGDKLARLIRDHAESETSRMAFRYVKWKLAWYVLNGYRRFDLVDPSTGAVTARWRTKDNEIEFMNTEILRSHDDVQGRLAAQDLRPRVVRNGLSLNSVRSAALAQAIADSLVSHAQEQKAKTQAVQILTALGCVGIAVHVDNHPTLGLVGDYEVIHPTELLPFPAIDHDLGQMRGIVRQRYVNLGLLKSMFPGKFGTSRLERMEWVTQRPSEPVPSAIQPTSNASTHPIISEPISGGEGEYKKEEAGYVLIRELWLLGPKDTVTKYAVASGEVMIFEEDYEGMEVYCPIGIARFFETGTFHGAGLFDLLYWMNREVERLLKSLFNNIRDIDRYGILVMPRGLIPNNPALRDVGRGLRVVDYDSDPVMDGFSPFHVAPFNSGDVPGRTAAFARDIYQQINPIRNLIEEKGRVDSSAGLMVLDDMVNQAISNPQRSIGAAFGDAYREMVRSSLVKMAGQKIPVTHFTLDLAGAIIDPSDGSISFNRNPLPTISQLTFTVRETAPKSQLARLQQAREFVQEGLQDPEEFRLFLLEDNLDAPLWMQEHRSAYESVVRNILMLYGDGEENQAITVASYMSKPDLQLRVLNAFMGSPLMALRDLNPDIIEDFITYREQLMQYLGVEVNANPDDLALVSGLIAQQTQQAIEGQKLIDRMKNAKGVSRDRPQLALP